MDRARTIRFVGLIATLLTSLAGCATSQRYAAALFSGDAPQTAVCRERPSSAVARTTADVSPDGPSETKQPSSSIALVSHDLSGQTTSQPGSGNASAGRHPHTGNADKKPTADEPQSPPASHPMAPGVGKDAAPRNAVSLTLDRVINTTLLADPKLRAGFQAIAVANGDAVTASLKPNPELYVDTQMLPLTRPFTPTKQGGPPQTDVYLSYPIDWFLFGKRAAAMQASILGVRASEAEYAELVRQRVLEAATAYYDALEANALFKVARQMVVNLEQVEAITKKTVAKGLQPRVDLNRVRLNLLNTRQELRKADNNRVAARARLLSIMGQPADAPELVVAGTLEIPPAVKPLSIETAIATAEENRPDIQMLRWKVYSARAEVESEERKKYPTVTPQIGYIHQYQGSIGLSDADSYLLAVTTSLPFFNRNQGNRCKSQAVAVQSEFQLRAAMVALRSEVVQTTKQLQTAEANVESIAAGQLKLAKDVRESLNQAYQAGQRPLIDVLNAQNEFLQTYQLYVTMRANLHRAAVKYAATLGKGVAR